MTLHKPPFALKEIKLEVTHKCNLTCIHCSSEATRSCSREMPVDRALRLLDECLALGVKEVAFSGGEPLLWHGIYDAVARCSAGGIAPTIYTSGNVDDSHMAMSLLKTNGATRAIFTLFAADEHAHDRITLVAGSFHKTLDAINAAQEAELRVELHFVPMRKNYAQLPRLIDLAIDRKVTRVSVLRFVPQGRGAIHSSMALTHAQNLELRRMVTRASERIELRAGSPYNFLLINESPECCAAIDRLTVDPQLRIYPCDAFKRVEAQDIVGTDDYSCLDRWPLDQCWRNSPYLAAVRAYLTTPFPAQCSTCDLLERCLSGCLAQKVITHSAFRKAPDPMCLKLNRS